MCLMGPIEMKSGLMASLGRVTNNMVTFTKVKTNNGVEYKISNIFIELFFLPSSNLLIHFNFLGTQELILLAKDWPWSHQPPFWLNSSYFIEHGFNFHLHWLARNIYINFVDSLFNLHISWFFFSLIILSNLLLWKLVFFLPLFGKEANAKEVIVKVVELRQWWFERCLRLSHRSTLFISVSKDGSLKKSLIFDSVVHTCI